MDSYLDTSRPPVYCPGCTHTNILEALDAALVGLRIQPEKVVIVSDIGCSGLFDTFFNTHAVHSIHGRALTHAGGLKLANPELTVIVVMGDGGMGIGSAHFLAACRRNLDLTLIILNNFNFGMTGGQASITTPADAIAGSGFLNRAEVPIDICAVALSGGATFVSRCSGLDAKLPENLTGALTHKGFSIVETLGICTGRYTRKNPLSPKILEQMVAGMPRHHGPVRENARPEYGEQYRKFATESEPSMPIMKVKQQTELPVYHHQEVIILGSAGMRIVTAGELLCHAGLAAGLHVSMKNDYNITVMRGQSVSEVILASEKINYTGIARPSVVLALSREGVERRKELFSILTADSLVVQIVAVDIPETTAEVIALDCTELKIKRQNHALAALAFIALQEKVLNREMLRHALHSRFTGEPYKKAMQTVETVWRYYENS